MVKKEIIWSRRTKEDLGLIWDHAAENFSVQKADEVTKGIVDQVGALSSFPRQGAISKDFFEIRELVVEGNVVFYRIMEERIVVAAIRPRRTNLKTF